MYFSNQFTVDKIAIEKLHMAPSTITQNQNDYRATLPATMFPVRCMLSVKIVECSPTIHWYFNNIWSDSRSWKM